MLDEVGSRLSSIPGKLNIAQSIIIAIRRFEGGIDEFARARSPRAAQPALPLFNHAEYAVEMLNIQRLAQNIPVAALFQEKGRVARDFAMLPGGEVWLASVELAGKSSQAPIPGKPKMLHSRAIPGGRAVDKFLEIPVDYRPVATKR